jgi:hypothetical protein
MVDGHCNSCVYFEDHKMMGVCKRYPSYSNRHSTEWCGEYKPAPQIEQEPIKLVEAKAAIEIARKPGRPKVTQ